MPMLVLLSQNAQYDENVIANAVLITVISGYSMMALGSHCY